MDNLNNINKEIDERTTKVNILKERGINPYPSFNSKKEDIKDILNNFDSNLEKNKDVIISGRLKSKRGHGNLIFANLEDFSSNIQIAFSKKEINEKSKLNFKDIAKLIDIGDFIEVKGKCFVTKKGENSIMINSCRILSKAIRPLPDKWHGLKDDDKRQRFRELEMLGDKNVLNKYKKRFQAIRVIREFMWSYNFTEIETPILQNVYGGTYARPFTTHYNELNQDFYLRIAPELFLKRAITGGFERIFEIGKCFRNEGMGPAHLQEFTMFEFYWPYTDYQQLMDFTEKMIINIIEKVYKNYEVNYKNKKINFKPPFKKISFESLIKEYLKIELKEIDDEIKLKKFLKEKNLEKEVDLKKKKSWASQMDEVYKKLIRNKIINPIFVTDYPKEFMALAKTKDDNEKIVATFQLVVNGWELIKAYNELNNPLDQKNRFEKQERLQKEGDEEAMPYDHDFIESMEYGMPPMAGWGMGLDRFFALLEGEENIRDMVLFPTMRKKE